MQEKTSDVNYTISTPKEELQASLHIKTELVMLATYCKLKIPTESCKADNRRLIIKHLVDKEIASEEEEDMPPNLELKQLEYQERNWECEN